MKTQILAGIILVIMILVVVLINKSSENKTYYKSLCVGNQVEYMNNQGKILCQ